MTRSLLRRTAILLSALFLFAQGSIALAACAMDRGSMAPVPAMEMAADGCDCGAMEANSTPSANCVAHCTADLQLPGGAAVLVRAACASAVLHVAAFRDSWIQVVSGRAPPPRGVPPRILLHSYLI
jgi:hypothetical protein